MDLKISTAAKEGELRCSKWLKHAVLLDKEELKSFWALIASSVIVSPVRKVGSDDWRVTEDRFTSSYEQYLHWLETEEDFPPPDLRREFTLMLSPSSDAFYAVALPGSQFLVKARRPPVQLQMYHCFISRFDEKIYPMAMNADSFTWGLQISYPQIYEEPGTGQFKKTLVDDNFPETALYKQIVGWLRHNTKPVLFSLAGKPVTAPFRTGKKEKDLLRAHKRFRTTLEGFVKI